MKDKSDHQLYGRMLESYEIRDGIKSGKYSTIEEVLKAVEVRSVSMETRLKMTNGFTGDSLPTKEEIELIEAIQDASKSIIH